jgi:D-alanyl-lipoteichoic acid acyltransferase DltB (MBOAT superfamily)
VAGPIERATHLLPQIKEKRQFNYSNAVDGLRQILWGLFKKMVIADNCAEFANLIFNNSNAYSGSTLVIGAFFFAFQIYGDFSGYSDIAIGAARLFGIDLIRNFAFPYFSRNIAEFWRRWHISLSSWFRDYLYIPLGGSKVGKWRKIRNVLIIFLVSGFWHGSNWTFLAWGFLNALYIIPSVIGNTHRNYLDTVAKGKLLPSFKELLAMLLTFCLTVFAWIFFRAENISHAFKIIAGIFSKSIVQMPAFFPVKLLLIISVFIFIEWVGREKKHAFELKAYKKLNPGISVLLELGLVFMILWYQSFDTKSFIYFQF